MAAAVEPPIGGDLRAFNLGVPVGLTRDSPDIPLFLYMCFEHGIHRKRVAQEVERAEAE